MQKFGFLIFLNKYFPWIELKWLKSCPRMWQNVTDFHLMNYLLVIQQTFTKFYTLSSTNIFGSVPISVVVHCWPSYTQIPPLMIMLDSSKEVGFIGLDIIFSINKKILFFLNTYTCVMIAVLTLLSVHCQTIEGTSFKITSISNLMAFVMFECFY